MKKNKFNSVLIIGMGLIGSSISSFESTNIPKPIPPINGVATTNPRDRSRKTL